jgi:hypothetical protein
MSYSSFQNIDQVREKYPLKFEQEGFLPDVRAELPAHLTENLRFALEMRDVQENEAFFVESLIYPLLQEAWKHNRKLKLWSHRALNYDDVLFGEPDYFLSVRPQGISSTSLTKPLLAVAAAKRDDFDRGWGQCLAEMIACQKFNENETIPIYGIVTNGLLWQFGKLIGKELTLDMFSYAINDPAKILGILHYIFAECEKQAVLETAESIG